MTGDYDLILRGGDLADVQRGRAAQQAHVAGLHDLEVEELAFRAHVDLREQRAETS